ncbi:MAG TPA: S41 family peptidase [Pyrinomonadaceae bacterium]|nr:S41 family peptidase [Pyrinomonadaceae bacterium]
MHYGFRFRRYLTSFLSIIIALTSLFTATFAQQLGRLEKEQGMQILSNIKSVVQKNYYDPSFHGVNIEERFKIAETKIKQASNQSAAFAAIAQALIDFNDSHTFFLPPSRAAKIEYGWQVGMVGDKAYVFAVKPKSDAEAKGLKVGDLVISINGFKPSRPEMWKVNYYYYQISPRSTMSLVVQSPDGEPRELEVVTKVIPLKRVMDLTDNMDLNELIRDSENESRRNVHRFKKVGNVMIWQMPNFAFDPVYIDSIVKDKLNGNGGIVLDLRGNPGGAVKTLERLAGYFFEKEVKIADMKRRKETEVSKTIPHGTNTYSGQIVVLVDSRSASASEILARLLQIEKRGYVIGDQSAGAVMQSRSFSLEIGTDRLIPYGVSVTDAEVIMTDGKSIEHVGVTPDELLIPTAADMSKSRDVALARAIEKAGGGKISPEDAGMFFPIEWDN